VAADPDVVTVPALVTLPGVDILAAGTWKLSTGETTFTTDDLAAAVDAASCPAVGDPIIKIGHTDKRFAPGDGEPAIGHVVNMSLAAEGNKITGDLAGMPGWLGDILPSAYPQRSIEGAYDLVCQIGHTHPFVITALALLGVTPPGVGVLNGLDDVAALYGVTATGQKSSRAWHLRSGDPMAGMIMAAGITTEDVRRAYYEQPSTSFAMWITEMQLDPPMLIVADEATNNIYRVPVTIKGGDITFGDPVQVVVEYQDVPAKTAAARKVVTFASAADSRAGVAAAWDGGMAQKNMGTDPSQSAINKMYALPADTKSDSKLPHHDCGSDGTVGGPNADGCSAAIGAINGGRGGLKGVSAADCKKAYNHLAAHLRSLGKEPPDYNGPSAAASLGWLREVRELIAAASTGDDDVQTMIASLDATLDQAAGLTSAADRSGLPSDVAQALDLLTAAEQISEEIMDALGIDDPDQDDDGGSQQEPDGGHEEVGASRRISARHGVNADQNVTHSHAHSAFGTQGGDATHTHEHTHEAGSATHNHHAQAKGSGQTRGAAEMDFSDEQIKALRDRLGLGDEDEITAEQIMAALAEQAEGGTVAAKLPEGVIAIDKDVWEATQRRIRQGEVAREQQLLTARDSEIAAAIRAGKFPLSRKAHWERLWQADPEGTRTVLAGLTPGAVPVEDIGLPGGPQDELLDQEYRSIFPPAFERHAAE